MYQRGNIPSDPAKLPDFLLEELSKIQTALSTAVDVLRLNKLYVAPKKPREGDIVTADGTTWNPGSGAGTYQYRSSAWVLLG